MSRKSSAWNCGEGVFCFSSSSLFSLQFIFYVNTSSMSRENSNGRRKVFPSLHHRRHHQMPCLVGFRNRCKTMSANGFEGDARSRRGYISELIDLQNGLTMTWQALHAQDFMSPKCKLHRVKVFLTSAQNSYKLPANKSPGRCERGGRETRRWFPKISFKCKFPTLKKR